MIMQKFKKEVQDCEYQRKHKKIVQFRCQNSSGERLNKIITEPGFKGQKLDKKIVEGSKMKEIRQSMDVNLIYRNSKREQPAQTKQRRTTKQSFRKRVDNKIIGRFVKKAIFEDSFKSSFSSHSQKQLNSSLNFELNSQKLPNSIQDPQQRKSIESINDPLRKTFKIPSLNGKLKNQKIKDKNHSLESHSSFNQTFMRSSCYKPLRKTYFQLFSRKSEEVLKIQNQLRRQQLSFVEDYYREVKKTNYRKMTKNIRSRLELKKKQQEERCKNKHQNFTRNRERLKALVCSVKDLLELEQSKKCERDKDCSQNTL